MTHEEMIAMAREAGLGEHTNYEYEQIWELKNVEALERFAALVIAAERERCAKECILMADDFELEVNQRGLVEKMKQHFGVK